ncbi:MULTISPECIES: fimbrial biogenesis usher protein [unclassified Serratia (in: enterobacteria)]|uniref:fimbrial biogenesis usher protein n=1 Tax=unclassified Serratia (in: enterobacteria) TaxID=2647522 RepID=UPI0005084E93|nr:MULTISPECIES: fimbrial biogenesis usher protein [unclassified Serratia (in: enterobacteria)]KFK91727.1 fimbrial protein [Serratia sp. Ag2]KFK95655.1 fimbrial protein [Serratia sp. Ag1]
MLYLKNGTESRRMMNVNHQDAPIFKLTLTPLALVLLVLCGDVSARAENYFNPRFLSDDPAQVADLSGFEKGFEAPPGLYRVDIYMNDGFMASRDVSFQADHNKKALVPCLTRSQLSTMGVNTQAIPGMAVLATDACVPLTKMIKDASTDFDVGRQRLSISVPQAFMGSRARGYIPPEQWQNGITAGLLNYSFTGSQVRSNQSSNINYAFLSLQSGVNLGSWRLRDNSSWSYSSGGSSATNQNRWQHINTYLQRDIVPLRSRLTLGDGYTSGDIFDGINFRGAQMATDDNMLPDSQRGFVPVIRGIARGTARVTIRQNGFEIYQTTVPPGPFTINDLSSAGNGGDLQVSIQEADGTAQVFTVPYASVPGLLREGHVRYSVMVGEYRSGSDRQEQPTFGQGTLMWGMADGWTLSGGTQLADRYRAFNLGVAKDLGILGAVSLDITQARATLPDDSTHQGQSLRFLYNKALNEWGTNLQLVGYRYSTRGYYSLADTTWGQMSGYSALTDEGIIQITPKLNDYFNLAYSKRGRLQLTVTQQVGENSTFYLTGSHQTYWQTGRTDEQLQAGYSGVLNDITYTLSYSLTKNAWVDGHDNMLAFNISIPFSHWLRSDSQSALRRSSVSYSMSDDLSGRMTNQTGMSGTLLEDNNLSYNVQVGYAGGGEGRSGGTGNAALTYRGASGNANVGYSRSNGYDQLFYGLSGGVLAHENGITLSQPLNDTLILVKAPGAGNVSVENQSGIRTDWRGYAVLPFAMDYRENRVALDPNTLANNIELDDAVVSVVPNHGAVVLADFKTHVGLKVLMTLFYNGKPLPFGSVVSFGTGSNGSIVADGGQVYLTGLPPSGEVKAKWGESNTEQCVANYQLPPESQQQVLSTITAQCR